MSCENCEESAYVIDKLAKLLAEIAVIVNGVEPHDTSWSYHDLPEKVRALKQAPPAAVAAGYALVPVEPTREIVKAFQDQMLREFGMRTTAGYHGRVYRAMLAAAREGEP
jgi:hypothetical protein